MQPSQPVIPSGPDRGCSPSDDISGDNFASQYCDKGKGESIRESICRPSSTQKSKAIRHAATRNDTRAMAVHDEVSFFGTHTR
jgi:hypothetical protein